MKKLSLFLLFVFAVLDAQFSVNVVGPKDFSAKEAYLYTLNGSKDILLLKSIRKGDSWEFRVPNSYLGMLKIYFPEANTSANFITENTNVEFVFSVKNKKIQQIDYKDDLNKVFYNLQDIQKKKEQILPALYQIQSFYKDNSPFGIALHNEIELLNSD